MKRIAILLLPLLFVACQATPVNSPRVSRDELAVEQQYQQQKASAAKIEKEQKQLADKGEMYTRLSKVFTPVAQAGAEVCSDIYSGPDKHDCTFSVELSDKDVLNAYADGQKIVVTEAMMRFVKDDNELALVLAHELSHNILDHVSATRGNAIIGSIVGLLIDGAIATQGVDTGGAFTNLGSSAAVLAYSQEFEAGADYVGMYILARAGFKYQSAPSFWRRMSERNPDAIYMATTHPSNPERFLAMQKTAEEITSKKKAHERLIPEVLAE